nr:multicopper oxidase domain-containing protein [Phycicoccus sp.]
VEGRTPDDVLAALIEAGGGSEGHTMGMGGMDHSMGMGVSPWGSAGDVTYPHFLINGRVPTDPETFEAKPGQRIRIRIINAASDTIFAVALNAHRMTITHTDGFAVEPTEVGALYLGMGERYDVVVTAGDGVFPLVAKPFDKATGGQAMALLRTGAAAVPGPDVALPELAGEIFIGSQLQPVAASALPDRPVDAVQNVTLQGSMKPYVWGINGAVYGENEALTVKAGQRLQLNAVNMTMMTHPLHLHGHTFALPSGLRKDTVLLAPMQSMPVVLDADNEGDWMVHCHNAYHGEAGMMIALKYT